MQITVGVLRGGPSREHEVSLQTGHAVLSSLPEDRFLTKDIYIDKQGVWHDRGRAISPARALRQVDVVVVALHGEYGEDGEVQKLLEQLGVPYTGSDVFGSFLAMHKLFSKTHAQEEGFLVPAFRYVEQGADPTPAVHDVIRTFSQPVIVKAVGWGSSVGVSRVGGYAPVLRAVEALLAAGARGVLIEEFVRGKEASVGVVEGLRGEAFYVLPPAEIIPPEGDIFSFEAKYGGQTREIIPGNFTRATREELARAAKRMHQKLGLRHYSRSDFIVSPRGIYYLETNSLPGLTNESILPKSLAAVGVSFPDFLEHLVNLTLAK